MSKVNAKVTGAICEIRLSRPEKKNAFTRDMFQTIADVIGQCETDSHIKVILLSAEGDYFSGGNDLQDFQDQQSDAHLAEVGAFMEALFKCSMPVVAKVQGPAVGIGATLLLHCDLVICADTASLHMPFVQLGLVPEFGSSYIIPRLAGHRKASKWLLLGEPCSAFEAENFGLVSHVVKEEKLQQKVQTVCDTLAALPSQALKHTKLLMKNEQQQIHLHMHDELDSFIAHLASPVAQEALRATLEKRQPDRQIYK